MLVVDRRGGKKYRFDANGEIEIDSPRVAKRFAAKFERKESYACPKCGRACKNMFGLNSHMKACGGASDGADTP